MPSLPVTWNNDWNSWLVTWLNHAFKGFLLVSSVKRNVNIIRLLTLQDRERFPTMAEKGGHFQFDRLCPSCRTMCHGQRSAWCQATVFQTLRRWRSRCGNFMQSASRKQTVWLWLYFNSINIILKSTNSSRELPPPCPKVKLIIGA